MKYALAHTYPGVNKAGRVSFGGSQRQLDSRTLQHCGCGLVAAVDLVRYLHLYHPAAATGLFLGVEDTPELPLPVYALCARRMCRNYVPILYPIGTTGFALAAGLNRYFQHYELPFTARWGVAKEALWREIASMLKQDLPVILSVGKQFPRFWEKQGVALHQCRGEALKETARIHAHFVTIVGMDDRWLRLSSWGQEYYLSKEEFGRYRSAESLGLLCNIVLIRRRDGGVPGTESDINRR